MDKLKKAEEDLTLEDIRIHYFTGQSIFISGEGRNKVFRYRHGVVNCTPFVRQYDILSNKWGVLLCQKEYQTNDIRRNSKNW